MSRYRFAVAVYLDGHFMHEVSFRCKWQAWLFHALLNRSAHHNGSRHW